MYVVMCILKFFRSEVAVVQKKDDILMLAPKEWSMEKQTRVLVYAVQHAGQVISAKLWCPHSMTLCNLIQPSTTTS